ncbi:MAG: glycosyltransferase [Aliiglaciecola sp.]
MEIEHKMHQKLLYDLAATHPGKLGSLHGGGIYAEAVFERLMALGLGEKLEVFYYAHKELPDNILELCQKNAITQHKICTANDIQELIDSKSYHSLYSAMPYELYKDTDTKNVRFIYTIHGLREIEIPYSSQQWRYSMHWKRIVEWLWASLFTEHFLASTKNRFEKLLGKENSEVITISQHSKYSILNQFGHLIKDCDLRVLYSPLLQERTDKVVNKQNSSDSESFFLIINGNRWIKNSYRALCALESFYKKNPNCEIKTLVLGLAKPPKRFRHHPLFEFKGYVSREELESAFVDAFAFIYPTLNEGFGYPPLEAMRKRTPVLASAVSAVPEVCGDAVLYFNPYDVNEIEIRIAEIYFDEKKRNLLVQKGAQKVKDMDLQQAEMLDQLCTIIINPKEK